MANTKPMAVDAGNFSSVYSAVQKNQILHKSLDFSNVGMPNDTIAGKQAAGNRALRQFHQTRIYIQDFENMISHNAHLNGSSAATYLISANLPQQIDYTIGSEWEAPLASFGNAKTNALMQVASGTLKGTKLGDFLNVENAASGTSRATTMKVWSKSKPLSLKLTIPVIDDNYNSSQTNLVEALEYLGCLCLPSQTNALGFYVPPPSPLNFDIRYGRESADVIKIKGSYGRIMVQIGGVLLIDRCIIEDIQVSYPNTKTLIKHTYQSSVSGYGGSSYLTPLLATVTITLSTIEAMTSNYYSQMLWMKPQSMGEGGVNITGAVEAISEGWNTAKEKFADSSIGKVLSNL